MIYTKMKLKKLIRSLMLLFIVTMFFQGSGVKASDNSKIGYVDSRCPGKIKDFHYYLDNDNNIYLEKYAGKNRVVEVPNIKKVKYEAGYGKVETIKINKIYVEIDTIAQDKSIDTLIIPANDRIRLRLCGGAPDDGSSPTKFPKKIVVRKGNKNYVSKGNVVYSKDMKTLWAMGSEKQGKFVIPDSVRTVEWPLANSKLDEIVIGKNVKEMYGCYYNTAGHRGGIFPHQKDRGYIIPKSVKSISVKKGNKYFTVKNNVLYSKDMTVVYGSGYMQGEYVMPSTVKKCCQFAFAEKNITKATVSDKVKYIPVGLFQGCKNLTEVNFGKNVKYIYPRFIEDTKVTELHIPEKTWVVYYEASDSEIKKIYLKNDSVRFELCYKDLYSSWFGEEKISYTNSHIRKYFKNEGIEVIIEE